MECQPAPTDALGLLADRSVCVAANRDTDPSKPLSHAVSELDLAAVRAQSFRLQPQHDQPSVASPRDPDELVAIVFGPAAGLDKQLHPLACDAPNRIIGWPPDWKAHLCPAAVSEPKSEVLIGKINASRMHEVSRPSCFKSSLLSSCCD